MPRRPAQGIELLADPTRRKIVALISQRVSHPAEIAAAIELSRPATSRQLRLLVDAGLIRWRWSPFDRRSRFYAVDPLMKDPIIAWLAGVDIARERSFRHGWWSRPVNLRPSGDASPDSRPDHDGSV